MVQESFSRIKERLSEIDHKIEAYKKCIEALEEEKINLLKEKSLVCFEKENAERESKKNKEEQKAENVTINRKNSAKEKADFLLNLFYSRRDVYAVRAKNKENKTTYYPKCHYFWSEPCKKRQMKEKGIKGGKNICDDCSFKIYDELTADIVIKNNLKNDNIDGINAIGIYPIFNGDCVRFIAYDFDEKDWEESSKIVVEVAKDYGFEAALERSFSGNGAHVWIFFKEDVKAQKVRKMAFAILDKACEKSDCISFKSFDRIFPMQDSVLEDGLGNLILMPLVKSAATRKDSPTGTVFVDRDLKMYPDQISYLSSLPRYTEKDIDNFLVSIEKNDFQLDSIGYEDVSPRWLKKLPEILDKDVKKGKVEAILSSGITISKDSLSKRLIHGLKKLSSFYNPEYIFKQKLNKGYANINEKSVIEGFTEDKTCITLPRGIKEDFERYLQKYGIKYVFKDERVYGTGLEVKCSKELRKEQVPALEAFLNHDIGIFAGATSVGKTVIAEKLIEARKEKTLIIVNNTNLLEQWEKALKEDMTISNNIKKREGKRLNVSGVGVLGNQRDTMTGLIDVVTFQSLFSQFPEMVKEYGMVIIDECHHVAADTYCLPLQELKAKYVYGLTATDKRRDKLDKYIYWLCGPVIAEYSADKLAYERGISQYFVPRFTNSSLSIECEKSNNYIGKIKELTKDNSRNEQILADAMSLLERGRKILILTQLVEHVMILKEKLQERGLHSIAIVGSMSRSERKDSISEIKENTDGKSIIISTGQYLGEGTDIPYLDTLLMATPISWEGKVSQFVGRIAREYEGKQNTLIYDYVDFCIPLFYTMYQKRIKTYSSLGYISYDPFSGGKPVSIDTKSFYLQHEVYSPLLSSISNARKEIIVSSPSLFPSASVSGIIAFFEKAIARGVTVRVITSSHNGTKNIVKHKKVISDLEKIGVFVDERLESFHKFVLIDSSEVWFGNINILGNTLKQVVKNKDEENVMLHLYDKNVWESLYKQCYMLM